MPFQSFDLLLETLDRYLHYDPETGLFTWKVAASSRRAAGSMAGTLHTGGYWTIRVRGCRGFAHRIAWAMHYREDPEHMEVDHINCNRLDNRIINLRLVDRVDNQRNRAGANKNSRSGLRGVYYHARTNKWRAQLGYDYRSTHLGLFDTPEEAHAAFLAAA
jgi:hypothetical protein